MKVILISGKSASGKDTFADLLRENLEQKGKRVLTIHFGDPVKMFATKYYNWDGQKDVYGRTLLQTLGTNKVRAHYPNYWGDMIGQFIDATAEDWDYVLIPDLRFLNELRRVQKFNPNSVAVRIVRYNEDGTPYYNPNMNLVQLAHPSETDLDTFCFDWYVENSGTVDDLRDAANDFLQMIGE